MPKQKGIITIIGTIADVTYYKMKGTYYTRSKTSLNKQRVTTDPSFANSRKSAGIFAKAAVLASQLYWTLPKAKRKHGLIGKITGQVNRKLQQGITEEVITEEFKKEYRIS